MSKFDLKSLVAGVIIGTLGLGTVWAASPAIKSAEFKDYSIILNGDPMELDNKVISVITTDDESNAKVYMPLREILEPLGVDVNWIADSSTIEIDAPFQRAIPYKDETIMVYEMGSVEIISDDDTQHFINLQLDLSIFMKDKQIFESKEAEIIEAVKGYLKTVRFEDMGTSAFVSNLKEEVAVIITNLLPDDIEVEPSQILIGRLYYM